MLDAAHDPRFVRVSQVVERELDRLPIPGVAVGVLYEGQEHIGGFGVTSVENPLPVTPETLFQIGSITKTFVAVLVMRLVEMNKLELDATVRTYLPELRLKDEDATTRATLRHCLTHTGGWEGDYFDDMGRGDDALTKMVEAMSQLPQLTPVGTTWSYNNAGFYLLGAVIERVTGKSFEAAMQDYVFTPLGLSSSYFLAEEVITHRFVVGHEKREGKIVVARPWAMTRTASPAGGIISHVPDLFRYARLYLNGGVNADGVQLLAPESLAEMQSPRVRTTDPQSVGLSWFLEDVGGIQIMSHGGATHGQTTRLAIALSRGFATAILTNSGTGAQLINRVLESILETYLGIKASKPGAFPTSSSALAAYGGLYDAASDQVRVTTDQDSLVITVTEKGGFPTPQAAATADPEPPVHARFYERDRIILLDEPLSDTRAEFLRDKEGRIEWLRIFGRIHRRVSED